MGLDLTAPRQPIVVAHRGFHDNRNGPFENSIGAFERAIAAGAHMLETDIHRTRDGVLVIYHDPILRDGRTIADLDFAQLPALPDGQRIPRLTEVAQLARARGVRLDAELKETGYERQAIDELASVLPIDQFEVISFEKSAIRAVEAYRPEVRTGLLSPRIWPWLRDSFAWRPLTWLLQPFELPLRGAEDAGADYVSVHWLQARNGLLDEAKRRGIDVDVWTVDDPNLIRRFMHDDRIRGVVTDRTDLAAAERRPAAVAGWQALVPAGGTPAPTLKDRFDAVLAAS